MNSTMSGLAILLGMTLNTSIQAANLYQPEIGEAYRITDQNHFNQSCVDISAQAVELIAPKVGHLSYKMNTNAESVQDIFDGRVALKLSSGRLN